MQFTLSCLLQYLWKNLIPLNFSALSCYNHKLQSIYWDFRDYREDFSIWKQCFPQTNFLGVKTACHFLHRLCTFSKWQFIPFNFARLLKLCQIEQRASVIINSLHGLIVGFTSWLFWGHFEMWVILWTTGCYFTSVWLRWLFCCNINLYLNLKFFATSGSFFSSFTLYLANLWPCFFKFCFWKVCSGLCEVLVFCHTLFYL